MSNYVPRTTSPDYVSPYWIGISYGGYNKFRVQDTSNGTTLPNCTAYAEGRWMEIMGWTSTNIARLNATDWFAHTSDGYPRGQEPRLGAIICWRTWGAHTLGHVGIVEVIHRDSGGNITSIDVSYSASGGARFTFRTGLTPGNGYKYKTDCALQGFIYLPQQPEPVFYDSHYASVVAYIQRKRKKKYKKEVIYK